MTESKEIKECGKCGSTRLQNLSRVLGEGTIICYNCNAHWWQKWYTRAEWDKWIEDEDETATVIKKGE